jgi:hypothetical protein
MPDPGPNEAGSRLDKLPNEMLSAIYSYLDRPRDVANLSLACKRLRAFTNLPPNNDGWRAFLHGRFRGVDGNLKGDPRETLHGLTTLYRNWNQKSFLAKRVQHRTLQLGSGGQTIGFQPFIDSYETQQSWSSRKEVLAFSAGPQVFVRLRYLNPASPQGPYTDIDDYQNPITW